METYDKQAAFRAVIARIHEKVELNTNGGHESGPRRALTWLADQLKLSRQSAYYWEKHGIPEANAKAVAELLDMDPVEVCPSLAFTFLPTPIFNAIMFNASKKTFSAKMVELIQRGLQARRAPEQPMKAVGGFVPISAEELATQRKEALAAGADLSVRGRRK